MKKILAWLFIVIGTGVMVISTSTDIMKMITESRKDKKGPFAIGSNAKGDLVRMSYLDNNEKFVYKSDEQMNRPVSDSTNRNIDLYIYGDSYTMMIPDSSVFKRVSKYQHARRDHYNLEYALNPLHKSVLLLEFTERFIRLYMPRYPATFKRIIPVENAVLMSDNMQITAASFIDINKLFNPKINSNIEYNLFNYRFLSSPRLLKADLNYKIFNRVSGDVVISDNGEFLFFRPTVEPVGPQSSYAKIPEELLKEIGHGMDSIRKYYRKAGFDEVVFSIIPNPVTILQPEGYNQMIPLLQDYFVKHGIPFINAYDDFRKYPDPSVLFRKDDSHWTYFGLNRWLGLTNKELERISNQ